MPRWLRFSLVALLLAIPVAWWILRASSEPPSAPGPAPAPVAAAPALPTAAPAPPAKPPEADEDDAEVAEDSEEDDSEDEEKPTGPCIAVEVTANGAPIPGVRVTAALRDDEDSYSESEPVDLKPDGKALSWCEPGKYFMVAYAPGFAPSFLEIVEPTTGSPPVARFQLKPGLTVSGHVLDKDSQQPIPQATLNVSASEGFGIPDVESLIEDATFLTDTQGAFRITDLTSGTYDVTIEAPGHSSKRVELSAPRPEHLSIELEGTSRLEGQVVDAEGAPMAGAVMWLNPSYHIPGGKKAPRTDEQGRFSLEVPEGIYWLGASAGKLKGQYEHQITVVRGSLVDGLTVRLQPTGAMSGKIFLRSSQKPIDHAVVALRHASSSWGSTQMTDEAGIFRFENILPGEYRIRVTTAEWPDVSRESLRVESGQELTVEIPVIQRATLEGRLTDGLGRPAEGATVRAVPLGIPDGEKKKSHEARSDEKGHYDLDTLEAGRYRIEALYTSKSPPITRELAIQEGETAHADFAFPEILGEVEGTVHAAGGGPLRSTVLLSVTSGEESRSEVEGPDESGHFHFQLPPGKYAFSAQYMDGDWDYDSPGQPVTVEAGKLTRVRLTVPDSLVETRGIVLDSRGEPASEVDVTLMGDEVSASGQTDARGRFKILNGKTKAGVTATLRAVDEKEQGILPNVRVGSSGVVIRLLKGAGVRGRVVATNGPPIQGFELIILRQEDASSSYAVRSNLPFPGDTFEQVDLPSGQLECLVSTTDGRSGKAAVRVGPGQTGTVEVPVGGLAQVRGRLLDPEGKPHRGWIQLDSGTPQEREDYANDDGRFELFALEPGTHVLQSNLVPKRSLTLRDGEVLDLGDLRMVRPPPAPEAPQESE